MTHAITRAKSFFSMAVLGAGVFGAALVGGCASTTTSATGTGGTGSGGTVATGGIVGSGGGSGTGGAGTGGGANSGGTSGSGGATTDGGSSTDGEGAGGAGGSDGGPDGGRLDAPIDGRDDGASGGQGDGASGGGGGSVNVGTGGRGGNAGAAGGRGGTVGTGTGGRGGGGGTAGAGGAVVYSPCPALPAACRILPFGDSITFGVGSSGGGYRVELFHRALADGKKITFVGTAAANGPATVDGVAFPRQHEGHSGYTIDNFPASGTQAARTGISPLVATVLPATRPDIVTLMIGTNDIQHNIDVTNAPARLGRLIDSIIAADAHTLVVVAQIVPTTDATVNAAVQAYNAAIPALVNARAAAGKHVVLVDMYRAIASDPNFKLSGRVVADPTVGPMNDWLHPNAAGYRLMGAVWYDVMKSALR